MKAAHPSCSLSKCELEQWSLTPDNKKLFSIQNCGDVDSPSLVETSRVIRKYPISGQRGRRIEWKPVDANEWQTLNYLDPRHSIGKSGS